MPHGHVVDGLGVGKTTRRRHLPSLKNPTPPGSQLPDRKRSVAIFLHNAVAIHRRIFCAKKEMVIYMEMVQNLKENYQISIDFMNFIWSFIGFMLWLIWRWWEIWQLGERTRKLIASHQIQIVTLKEDKFRCFFVELNRLNRLKTPLMDCCGTKEFDTKCLNLDQGWLDAPVWSAHLHTLQLEIRVVCGIRICDIFFKAPAGT